LSPVNKVIFNWKVESFPRVLKSFGKIGFESPEFKVVSSDGEVHSLKLRFKEYYSDNGPVDYIEENGDVKDIDELTLINVEVINTSKKKFCLAGSLVYVNEENDDKVIGMFGNPVLAEFNDSGWVFENKFKILVEWCGGDKEDLTNYFCVDYAIETMKIKVELTTPGIVTNSIKLVPSEFTVKEIGANRLFTDIKSLMTKADEYADFNIACEGQMFPCHEAILRTRSPVFDKMFQQEMKESSTRQMTINDVKKDTIGAMLEYLYTGEVKKKVENESELVYVADKYELAGLLELCLHKLIEVEENMVVDILIMADRHDLKDFKKVAMQRILMNKSKFGNDTDFVEKMKQTPNLLVELFQQFK